ncbi:MAG: hypothetical protein H6Q43_3644, partial [Deltaproteobacteria bacterium]|nr:hypothetical protein [Deltaproteobacteria bacterium]
SRKKPKTGVRPDASKIETIVLVIFYEIVKVDL